MPSTRASCFSLTIGPRSTSSRYGSPRRSRVAFDASSEMYSSATRAMDDVAADREADLALELERGVGPRRGGRLQVGVIQDHEGVVAAELEGDLLEQASGEGPDAPAGRRGPGERDHVHVRVGDQGLAHVRPADDDLQQPLREAGLAEDGGEDGAAADGRLRVRLQDDGVAQGERRRDDAHAEDARRVPRGDGADDPDRHAPHHREAVGLRGRQQRPVRLGGHRRGVQQLLHREVLLVVHLVAVGAGLALRPRPELRPMGLVDGGGAAQDGGPLLVVRLRPRGLGRSGRCRCPGDVVGRRLAEGREQDAGGRLALLDRLPGARSPVVEERVEPSCRCGHSHLDLP